MLIAGDKPKTTITSDPELLIEEARELQRRRQTRRAAILLSAVILVAVSIGIARLARGGSSVKSADPPAAGAAAGSTPSVIYEKVELVSNVPHRPTGTAVFGTGTVIETWIVSDEPRSWRATVPGRPYIEYGETLVHDPLMGPTLVSYVYDRNTKRIYEMGSDFPPSTRPAATPAQAYRRLLATPGAHLAGTRTYIGHTVYVVRFSWPLPPNVLAGSRSRPTITTIYYIDARSYVPVYHVLSTDGPRGRSWIGERALAWKTLPATAANLKLANLATAHPGTTIVPERVARVSGSIYNTEPAPIPGLAAALVTVGQAPALLNQAVSPPYWHELYNLP
jgi:hypothetical protein